MEEQGNVKNHERIRTLLKELKEIIENLEHLKNQVVDHLNSRQELEQSVVKMWIGDMKELYYSTFAAFQLFSDHIKGYSENATACLNYLKTIKSRLEQVSSELISIDSPESRNLERELRSQVESFSIKVKESIESSLSLQERFKPGQRVVKITDDEYHLPCATCGKSAVMISVEVDRNGKKDGILYEGLTHSRKIDLKHQSMIFNLLDKQDLAGLHEYFKEHLIYEGVDAYCPECDKIYCRDHYVVQDFFDEGFYDYSMGTCPEGHSRIVDD
ncbi:MAG: hypothetical protein ACXQS8_00835 [Candidatus Helarchaeales archaeon]